jgi:hypothetical protein
MDLATQTQSTALAIPPIDTLVPDAYETASFGLG